MAMTEDCEHDDRHIRCPVCDGPEPDAEAERVEERLEMFREAL